MTVREIDEELTVAIAPAGAVCVGTFQAQAQTHGHANDLQPTGQLT